MKIRAIMCAGVAQYTIPLLERVNGFGERDDFYAHVVKTHKDWTSDTHFRGDDGLARLHLPSYHSGPYTARELSEISANLVYASRFLSHIPTSYCSSNANQPVNLEIDPLNVPKEIK